MKTLRNTINLIGNLKADAEVKSTKNDKAMIVFTMATSEKWKNEQGEEVVETEWHDVIAFRNSVETANNLAQHLTKGQRILVEGKLTYRNNVGKVGPNKDIEVTFRNATVVMNDLEFLGSKKEEPAAGQSGTVEEPA